MNKQQSPDHLEFGQCVVTGLHSAHTFLAIDSNTNIRLFYHRHIVSAITNCQTYLFKVSLDHPYSLRFLDWQHPATDNTSKMYC